MPIDWSHPDFVFLKKQLLNGEAILFAGAGLSHGAKNQQGNSPAMGGKLAPMLAAHGGFKYASESLPEVFSAVRAQVGQRSLNIFLTEEYHITEIAPWHNTIPSCVWHRIYTTNIDDLFYELFPATDGQKLDSVVCPDDYRERDPLFESIQCVYLHGCIKEPAKGFTFTHEEFASHTGKLDPWYTTFIDDFYNKSIVFVGYGLEEAPFYHYLNLRDTKDRETREYRPKSYLVSPNIGHIRSQSLRTRNIISVESTAEEFFESLAAEIPHQDRTVDQVRERVYPHHIIRNKDRDTDIEFSRNFDLVVRDLTGLAAQPPAASFFLGAEPTWFDLKNQHDAHREVNDSLLELINDAETAFQPVILLGPAGSGKSTSLMRVALSLSQNGGLVYFANARARLDFVPLLKLVDEVKHHDRRVFVFIDNASTHRAAIHAHKEVLQTKSNLSLILCDRTNRFRRRPIQFDGIEMTEVVMPNLTEPDILNVIERLETFGELGALKGLAASARKQAFLDRAEKQMLVAMREATSGRGFDLILRDEFDELPHEGQLAYTICSLAVDRGAPGVYRKHLLPSLGKTTLKKTALLNENLRGVLVSGNLTDTLIKPRHRLIAHWVATEIASADLKLQAIRNLLAQISPEIVPNEIRRRSPAYLAYRGMINSRGLQEAFDGDFPIILGLYEDLRPYYENDFLFWMHYAMAHIEDGNLDQAENYLNQSQALAPRGSFQTRHQLGILYLRQAVEYEHPGAQLDRANNGIKILKEEIAGRGDTDSYVYHAYITYVSRWLDRAGRLRSDETWEGLRKVVLEAERKHSLDDMLKQAIKEHERLYMMRAVKK